jgi:Domain of unknown function (DUF4345)
MERSKLFLIITAIGLTPIALSYGAMPSVSLQYLFGISVDTVNLTHIFRAVMGLYLALIVFWIAGAVFEELTVPALWSLVVFMCGLAAGRILSLLLDGIPSWLLVAYLLLELAFGAVGLILLRSSLSDRHARHS